MKILVTGVTGFVGSVLIEYLANIQGCAVVGMVRSLKDFYINTAVEFRLGEIGSSNNIDINLSDIDSIIHTATSLRLFQTAH
jgi:nucleoside-diphosphate-sugar epimerase